MGNEVRIRATVDDKATKEIEGISSKIKGALGGIAQVAGGMVLAGVFEGATEKLIGFADGAINAAKETKAASAQLDAVIKSTGNAANVSAEDFKAYAAQLEKVSLFEDEAIIGAESLLLTFTNISGPVVAEATQAVLDMSQALGQDLKSSSVQVGKALNDPIKGITALSRVGVTFTDEQKKMIAEMVKVGDTGGAQRLILAELTKEFGGSAKAASDAAGASEKQRDRMNELNEVIGAKLLPIQEKWKEAQVVAIDYMISKVIPTIEALYAQHWPAIEKVIREKVIPSIEALQPVFKFMAENAIEKIEGTVQVIEGVVEVVTRIVDGVKAIVRGDWAAAWDEFKGIPAAILDTLEGLFRALLGKLPDLFYNAGKDAGSQLLQGVKDGAGSLLGTPGLELPVLGQLNPFRRASGGPVNAGQPYIVGENGPELMVPSSSGNIVPNGALGGDTVVNVWLDGELISRSLQKRQGRGLALAMRGV